MPNDEVDLVASLLAIWPPCTALNANSTANGWAEIPLQNFPVLRASHLGWPYSMISLARASSRSRIRKTYSTAASNALSIGSK